MSKWPVDKEQRLYDKSTWPPGPWIDEPDRIAWRDEETDLNVIVKRQPTKAWCGYVAIPKGHPMREGLNLDDIEVHGGITYGAECDGDPANGVCHVAANGDDDVLWVGFDCAHYGDLVPGLIDDGEYRTVDYVVAETLSLARQVRAASENT